VNELAAVRILDSATMKRVYKLRASLLSYPKTLLTTAIASDGRNKQSIIEACYFLCLNETAPHMNLRIMQWNPMYQSRVV